MSEKPSLSALGIRKKFRQEPRFLCRDIQTARKNILFHQQANITKSIYLFVDELEYKALLENESSFKDLKHLVILRPSGFSSSHAAMQQWHLNYLRREHSGVVALADGDLGISGGSKHFPALGVPPAVRAENHAGPLEWGFHCLHSISEFEKAGILLGGYPIDPPTPKGSGAYEPIIEWVVRCGFIRNFFVVFPDFRGWFGSPIGTGLGVLEDAHFGLSGGREKLGIYQGICLRWAATKTPIIGTDGTRHFPRNTVVATEPNKRQLAAQLDLPLDAICDYLGSRYIKEILNKAA